VNSVPEIGFTSSIGNAAAEIRMPRTLSGSPFPVSVNVRFSIAAWYEKLVAIVR